MWNICEKWYVCNGKLKQYSSISVVLVTLNNANSSMLKQGTIVKSFHDKNATTPYLLQIHAKITRNTECSEGNVGQYNKYQANHYFVKMYIMILLYRLYTMVLHLFRLRQQWKKKQHQQNKMSCHGSLRFARMYQTPWTSSNNLSKWNLCWFQDKTTLKSNASFVTVFYTFDSLSDELA